MIYTEAPSAPFSVDSYFSAAAKNLSNTDRRLIATVDKRLGELNTLAGRFSQQRMNQRHALDEDIEALEAQLAESPTEETALAIHSLIVRREQAVQSAPTISAALDRNRRSTIDQLAPIAIKLIDQAEADFTAAATDHRTKNADSVFSAGLTEFNSRAGATVSAFAEKRRWVKEEAAAAHFLLVELGIS